MTKILKAHIEPLKDRISNVYVLVESRTRLYYNTRKIELLFSTPEDIEVADEFRKWVKPSQISNYNPLMELPVVLRHPCVEAPKAIIYTVDVDHVFGQPVTIWPSTAGTLRPDYDTEVWEDLRVKVEWQAQQRVGLALLRKVIEYLLGACTTYEQMRWLFPPIVPFLRGMDGEFRSIATLIERNRSNQSIRFPLHMRDIARYVCEFWATHELLGTFYKEEPTAPAGHKHIDPVSRIVRFDDEFVLSL